MNLMQIKFWFILPIFLSTLLLIGYLLSGFYIIMLSSKHQLKRNKIDQMFVVQSIPHCINIRISQETVGSGKSYIRIRSGFHFVLKTSSSPVQGTLRNHHKASSVFLSFGASIVSVWAQNPGQDLILSTWLSQTSNIHSL